MQKGRFYMSPRFKDVCVQVLESRGDGYLVSWWNLGFTGNPWPIGEQSVVYINGNWRDVTELLNIPRQQWQEEK